jgi:hypothetical protein
LLAIIPFDGGQKSEPCSMNIIATRTQPSNSFCTHAQFEQAQAKRPVMTSFCNIDITQGDAIVARNGEKGIDSQACA